MATTSRHNGIGNSDKQFTWLLTLAIVATVVYHAYAIARIPAFPTDDDGAYAAAGYQIWQTGKPGVAGYKSVAGMGEDIYVLGHIGAAVQGIFTYWFGVDVKNALLPSFLIGVASLIALFLLGKELWGLKAGLLAALLLSLSGIFFNASHSARPDLLVAFFLLVALWLVVSALNETSFQKLFLAGLMMGISGDAHPNGFLLAPLPYVFWILAKRPAWGVLWRGTLLYALGGLFGIVYWLARHYWPQTVAFHRQSSVHGLATHGIKILDRGLTGAIGAELQRYLNWFWNARGHRHLLEGICVLASGAYLLWRGGRTEKAIVLTWVAFFLIAAALMSNSFGWYLIFAWPMFALWMARAFEMVSWQWVKRGALAAVITAYLFNLGVWHWKARQETSLQTRLSELRSTIPTTEPVFASAGLWFAFWDRDFTHEPYLPFREIEAKLYPETGLTGWEAEQRKLGWRYIVAYGNLRRMLDPEFPVEQMLAVEPWRNRKEEVMTARNFSLKRCLVIARLRSLDETITVFRVNDADQTSATNLP
ncbi:MAG: glycosyltransferase family 39 protein [Acidobacteriota bacterium]|nr:glycosyltransferase family 39 protein [Acidobacteriota bacterium]